MQGILVRVSKLCGIMLLCIVLKVQCNTRKLALTVSQTRDSGRCFFTCPTFRPMGCGLFKRPYSLPSIVNDCKPRSISGEKSAFHACFLLIFGKLISNWFFFLLTFNNYNGYFRNIELFWLSSSRYHSNSYALNCDSQWHSRKKI